MGVPRRAAADAARGAAPSGAAGGGALRAGSYLAIGAGLVLALIAVGASAAIALRNAAALASAARTQEIRSLVTQVVEDVTDAETGQRGYLLTDKPSYLDPYARGAAQAPAALDALDAQLGEDEASRPAVARLRALVAAKLTELSQTIDALKEGRRDAAMDVVQSDRGQREMQEIRELTARLRDRQQAVLTEQLRSVEQGGRLLVAIDAIGLALLLLLAAAIIRGARRALGVLRAAQGELARANEELEGVNERLEEKVTQRTADLTEANEEIQRFAYIVSHDLRAPLVNIMGFTSELETATRTIAGYVERRLAIDAASAPADVAVAEVSAAVREDLPEAIRFIKVSTAKMDRLIAAILKLSREGRRVMAPEHIDMAAFLRGIADSLQHQSAASGSEIVVQAVPDLAADRVMLEQVFSNLLENAVKYLLPGRPGRIAISGRLAGGMAVYEVTDNGRGIATRDRERVFELFRRAGDQRVPGEGIGLAHVRALVRRMGGTISCESREGVGSTFRVTLPVVARRSGDEG
jgi:signal transduction histidine kinase